MVLRGEPRSVERRRRDEGTRYGRRSRSGSPDNGGRGGGGGRLGRRSSVTAAASPPANLAASGLLAAESNSKNGVRLKYSEPVEARRAVGEDWRLYIYKGSKELDLIHLDTQSAFLFGRDRLVVDVHCQHPSISSQHAVIQFRQVGEAVRPFLIDLESTNGTKVNDDLVPTSRYYSLRQGDILKFGTSSREYVLLNPAAVSGTDISR